ncbi:type IV pilus modification protein PilV [Xylophilus sp. Kf1]|nr:type IV pilus modification protein PilV [Xylophilus sp. Kf1]
MATLALHIHDHRKSRVNGFSLVEVLVSIVVLSVGLLGMAALQASSLQANREARLQSTAVILARELGEMMRGNVVEAIKQSGNPYLVVTTKDLFAASTPSYCLNVGSTCANTLAIANAEMTEWMARVSTELPNPRVTVCFDTQPYDASGMPVWPCTAPTGVVLSDGAPVVVKMGWTRTSTDRTALMPLTVFADGSRPAMVMALTAGAKLDTEGAP